MTEDDRKLVAGLRKYAARYEGFYGADLAVTAAARITALFKQMEAKDARIAELERERDELDKDERAEVIRAEKAEAALAKSQAEVERAFNAGYSIGYSGGNTYEPGVMWKSYQDVIARTALENHDDQ